MKKLVIILGIISAVLLTTTTVLAYNQNSGYFAGPHAQVYETHESSTYALSSAKAPVTGAECEVWFKSFGWLHDTMQSWNNRHATVILMEEDAPGNADDPVKKYTVDFEGLHVSNIYYSGIINEGNIDSASDATAELYLTLSLDYISGDSAEDNNEIFYSDIRVN